MKKLLKSSALLTMLLTFTIASCKKTSLQSLNTIDAATASAKPVACADCDAKATAYDLSATLQTFNFKEGSNVVSSLANGTKIIARVKSGRISQWVLETKTGIQLAPQSTEMTARMINRFGIKLPLYRICFYLDGLYNCWLVIKI